MPAAGRTLTERELNRALLARQCLLGRVTGTVPSVVERVGGIQAQYTLSSYVGLWTRLDGFRRDDLDRALTRRSVVHATLLRATIHLVSARDYWLLTEAVRAARLAWFLRVQRSGLAEGELATAVSRARHALSSGPMRQAELDALVSPSARSAVAMHLDLVRVPPSATWAHRRADLYGLAEDWIARPDLDHDASLEHLVRRYLGAFGPAHLVTSPRGPAWA